VPGIAQPKLVLSLFSLSSFLLNLQERVIVGLQNFARGTNSQKHYDSNKQTKLGDNPLFFVVVENIGLVSGFILTKKGDINRQKHPPAPRAAWKFFF
jgi:hypothetical protein